MRENAWMSDLEIQQGKAWRLEEWRGSESGVSLKDELENTVYIKDMPYMVYM